MIKIRTLCNLTIAIAIPLVVYYIYRGGGWALNDALLEPERWLEDSWVDPNAVIASSTRWVFFALWTLPVVCGTYGYLSGVRLALTVRTGVLFEPKVARLLMHMGGGVTASALTKIFAACLSPMIKSWHNPDGPLPLRFWYSSEDYGLVVCGIGFIVMGLVIQEAIKLARENEAFV